MAKMRVGVKAAIIAGCLGIVGSILASLVASKGSDSAIDIVNNNSGNQNVGPGGVINVVNAKSKKRAVKDLLENSDIHLGDNVYPAEYGVSYNPLTQDIYPQPVPGVIFYDKETGDFLSDRSRPTQVGQLLVSYLSNQFKGWDFSSYKYIYSVAADDPNYSKYIKDFDGTKKAYRRGANFLIGGQDLEGNYYMRHAAVGYAKSFSLLSLCRNFGLDFETMNLRVKVILNTYHGGLREGQSENYILQFNNYRTAVESATTSMRHPQEIEIDIPFGEVSFKTTNMIFLHVLPWEESTPEFTVDGEVMSPVHFRDVGVISIEVLVEEI